MTIKEKCDDCGREFCTCPTKQPSRARAPRAWVEYLEVSPQGMAHLPGCTHKDDDDWSRWGRIATNAVDAWQRLANREHVQCDSGETPERIAVSRCRDCIERVS